MLKASALYVMIWQPCVTNERYKLPI